MTVQEVSVNAEKKAHGKTLQQLAVKKAQVTRKNKQIALYKRLLAKKTESRRQQMQQDRKNQSQPDEEIIYISDLAAMESRLEEEQAASSVGEVNDLRTALEEARLRVSDLEVEVEDSKIAIRLKDNEIENLKLDAAEDSDYIEAGMQELRGFLRLSAKLYNRLNRAEKMLKGALGRDDRLMRSAVRKLARWHVPVETYFRDVVRTEAEVVSEVDLAIVRRPADYSAIHHAETGHVYQVSAEESELEQRRDEIDGAADTDGDVSGSEGPAYENPEVEEPKSKSRKTSKTASIFAAAAGIDLSSSSQSSEVKGKQKEERTPAFGEEGSRIFSFLPSEDGVSAEQTPRYQDPEVSSQSFNFSSTGMFDFAAGTAGRLSSLKGWTPTFGGSSGSSAGAPPCPEDRGEDKQKQESIDKATKDPLFSAEAIAKFDSGPSGSAFNFDNVNFPTMGASEGQVDSSQSSPNSGTAVADKDGDYDYLYDLEDGYVPPKERLTVVDQAGVELSSTADTNGGEEADGDSTGVPRITITPASAFEHKVEVGNSHILETNGFDVAALSRIVGSRCPVTHENLEGENHGAESLLERLLPREGHYPSFAEATGIQNVGWQGRGRTAEEILLDCENSMDEDLARIISGMENLHLRPSPPSAVSEEDLALIISGIENLHLGPSLPSAGSQTGMENAPVEENNRPAEREVPGDEPQTKVVKEDVRATAQPDVPPVSQPNESSSATVIDDTVQPSMGLQAENTAPSSSSSPSYSSSSSSSFETPISTPPAAHEPPEPEPERRSKLGNPLDKDGRVSLWNLSRKKKSGGIGKAQQ